MLKNPILLALAGGVVSALATAGPLIDDGCRPSEWCAIALAFATGTGLTAVRPKPLDGAEDDDLDTLGGL